MHILRLYPEMFFFSDNQPFITSIRPSALIIAGYIIQKTIQNSRIEFFLKTDVSFHIKREVNRLGYLPACYSGQVVEFTYASKMAGFYHLLNLHKR